MTIKKKKLNTPEDTDLVLDEETEELIETISGDLERYHNHNVSLLKRELSVGPITNPKAVEFHKNLRMLESMNKNPITIHIHSEGGFCDAGWLMYDALMESDCDIIGICWGICASMAVTILQACEERIIAPMSGFMLHDGSDILRGPETVDAKTPIAYGKEAEYEVQKGYEVLFRRSGLSWEQLQQLVGGADCYLTPQEAIECGFADKVGEIKKKFKKMTPKKASIARIIREKGFHYIKRRKI